MDFHTRAKDREAQPLMHNFGIIDYRVIKTKRMTLGQSTQANEKYKTDSVNIYVIKNLNV